jgi:hypothetical protein
MTARIEFSALFVSSGVTPFATAWKLKFSFVIRASSQEKFSVFFFVAIYIFSLFILFWITVLKYLKKNKSLLS